MILCRPGLALLALAFALPIVGNDVEQCLKKVRGKTISQRVDSASRGFLGVPYLDAPLGDGPQALYDQGPLYRFDAFDCTTFVETVLALAISKDTKHFERHLEQIRYSGKPSFITRNHFPCIDWIPHNTQSGLLMDITEKIGAPWGVEKVHSKVSKKTWFEHLPPTTIRVPGLTDAQKQERLKKLHAEGRRFQPMTPELAYIPLTKIIRWKEISPEEKARRKQEEEEFARSRRNEGRSTQSLEEDLDKKIHDETVNLRLRYLVQDTEVDQNLINAIPTGSIMNVVRPGWSVAGTTLNISHQGFVIRKKQGVYFRHVSKSGGRAKDVLLENYLRLCLLLPAIKGVHFLAVNDLYPRN